MLFLIHQAQPEIFGPALELLQRFFSEEGFATPPDQIRANLRAMLGDPHHAVFLAYRDEQALGVATVMRALSIEYSHYAEIEDLYVLPEHRGQGVARALVAACLAWCRTQACSLVLLTLTPEGEAAHGLTWFYQRLGFHDTGRSIMALDLTPGPSPHDNEQERR